MGDISNVRANIIRVGVGVPKVGCASVCIDMPPRKAELCENDFQTHTVCIAVPLYNTCEVCVIRFIDVFRRRVMDWAGVCCSGCSHSVGRRIECIRAGTYVY